MKKGIALLTVTIGVVLASCEQALNPKPIDLIVNDVVLNEPKDVAAVEIGLYRDFRLTRSSAVFAGDLTADHLIHRGTFAQYRELAVKQITTGNATVSEMWATIYGTVYIANFIIERLPEVPGVSTAVRSRTMATAYFLRGMAYFTGVVTFGGMPKVISNDIETNKNIGRTSEEEMLAFIEEDFMRALGNLGAKQPTPATLCDNTVRAALARFYLYQKDYVQAEQYANDIIESGDYELVEDFAQAILKDFSSEAIFEVGYTINDDADGTNLTNVFVTRREVIPTNEMTALFNRNEAGEREATITFRASNQKGSDNGFEVSKYGTALEDNNNILVFGLPEMYLIRAEARAMLGVVTGDNSAQSDINVLRKRASSFEKDEPTDPDSPNYPKRPIIYQFDSLQSISQTQMIQTIETERRLELAYEGHRWYDLKRTGRIEQVMPSFSSNWKAAYELWPIPQREIQNNPALVGEQNPGY
jgi:hypothetical protein